MLTIRNEKETDYQDVEALIREAFYNLYIPGCVEHYLVHVMRGHEDFIPELDFVLEMDGRIIGNIMYTKAWLIDEEENKKEILTFGPVCISPKFQRKGCGKRLLEYSFEKAAALGYDAIVIFGNPANYVARGFKSCKKHNVCLPNGAFPAAMLVKELQENALNGKKWSYQDSPVMQIDEKEAKRFDDALEKMEKRVLPCQEEFYILSHSTITQS
ncbi:MAG: N-acetyltransferase [Lachnospiraceae bacterium]|nr:N-acetyltransferase [Lachnospiraceae bacterium]